MNKKGFTMMELLATITILGIISTVAVVMVSRYLTRAQDQTYDSYVDTIYDASRMYLQKFSMFKPKSGESIEITAGELIEEQFIDSLQNPRNNNETCDYEESKVIITNMTPDGEIRANDKLKYEITLICGDKEINKTVE